VTEQPLQAQRRLMNNTVLLSAGEIAGQVVNFVFVIALARGYGQELLGLYAFAMAVGAVLCLLMSLGTHPLLLRELSRNPGQTAAAMGGLLPFQMLVGVALLLLVQQTAYRLGFPAEVIWVLSLVVGFHLLMHLADFMTVGFDARQRMAPRALVQVSPRLGMLLLGGAAMAWGASAELALAAMPAATLLTLAAIYGFVRLHLGPMRWRLRAGEVWPYLKRGLPFFLVILLTTLYLRLGIIYLALLAGDAEAGVFAAAERLVVAAGVVHMMFGAALFPLMSRLWAGDRDDFGRILRRGMRVIVLISLPMATLLVLFAVDIINLLYGDGFDDAALVLAAVAGVLVVRGMAQILNITSIASERQATIIASKCAGIAVLTLSCLLAVPRFGALGLAGALVLSELLTTLFHYLLLRRSGMQPLTLANGGRVACACLLAALVAWFGAELHPVMRVVLVALGGGLGLWAFGAVRLHDLFYLRAIIAARA